jgi:hypothetical protein
VIAVRLGRGRRSLVNAPAGHPHLGPGVGEDVVELIGAAAGLEERLDIAS